VAKIKKKYNMLAEGSFLGENGGCFFGYLEEEKVSTIHPLI
jgi:hypothetical protein